MRQELEAFEGNQEKEEGSWFDSVVDAGKQIFGGGLLEPVAPEGFELKAGALDQESKDWEVVRASREFNDVMKSMDPAEQAAFIQQAGPEIQALMNHVVTLEGDDLEAAAVQLTEAIESAGLDHVEELGAQFAQATQLVDNDQQADLFQAVLGATAEGRGGLAAAGLAMGLEEHGLGHQAAGLATGLGLITAETVRQFDEANMEANEARQALIFVQGNFAGAASEENHAAGHAAFMEEHGDRFEREEEATANLLALLPAASLVADIAPLAGDSTPLGLENHPALSMSAAMDRGTELMTTEQGQAAFAGAMIDSGEGQDTFLDFYGEHEQDEEFQAALLNTSVTGLMALSANGDLASASSLLDGIDDLVPERQRAAVEHLATGVADLETAVRDGTLDLSVEELLDEIHALTGDAAGLLANADDARILTGMGEAMALGFSLASSEGGNGFDEGLSASRRAITLIDETVGLPSGVVRVNSAVGTVTALADLLEDPESVEAWLGAAGSTLLTANTFGAFGLSEVHAGRFAIGVGTVLATVASISDFVDGNWEAGIANAIPAATGATLLGLAAAGVTVPGPGWIFAAAALVGVLVQLGFNNPYEDIENLIDDYLLGMFLDMDGVDAETAAILSHRLRNIDDGAVAGPAIPYISEQLGYGDVSEFWKDMAQLGVGSTMVLDLVAKGISEKGNDALTYNFSELSNAHELGIGPGEVQPWDLENLLIGLRDLGLGT